MNYKIKTYQDLIVWQKAHQLVLLSYKIIYKYPSNEKFILISQTLSAVLSVAANIVEGFSRKSINNYLNHLDISVGSLEETKYHLLVAKDLKYITEKEYESVIIISEEVGRLLNGLIKSLRKKNAT